MRNERRLAILVLAIAVVLLAAAALLMWWPAETKQPKPLPIQTQPAKGSRPDQPGPPRAAVRSAAAPGGWIDYVGEQAKRLDNDEKRIEAFVTEQIKTEDYAGCLRGATGTLWAQAGNDVDRAVLREALLRAAKKTPTTTRPDAPLMSRVDQADWAGRLPPPDQTHRLKLTLRLEGSGGSDQASAEWPLAELAGRGVLLAFADGQAVLASDEGENNAKLAVGRWADETLWLDCTWQPPTGGGRTTRRQIYTRRYSEYAPQDDPRNQHVIVVTAGSVPPEVLQRERKDATSVRMLTVGRMASDDYLMVLSHLSESDKALADIAAHFKTRAYLDSPRIVVASSCFSDPKTRMGYRAIDLRRNEVKIEGEPSVRAAVGITRSAIEGSLEAQVLSDAIGHTVTGAMEIFGEAVEQAMPTAGQRLEFYSSSLDRLAGEPAGSRLAFQLDKDRQVELVTPHKGRLKVRSIAEHLRKAMASSGIDFLVLDGREFGRDLIGRAALELETLLGPAARSDVSYRPMLATSRPVEQSLPVRSRVFLFRGILRRTVLEWQILRDDGDIVYEAIDRWDEKTNKEHLKELKFTIPKKHVESSDILSRAYSQTRYDQGAMSLMASRKVHRELVENGQTVVRVMKADRSLTKPIRLYLCGRHPLPVRVNTEVRLMPFLMAAGGWDADDPPKLEFGKTPRIDDTDKTPLNQWIIMDDPRYPLLQGLGASFQTDMPGRVVSRHTGIGVAGAEVRVEETGQTARSWGDGQFSLGFFPVPLGPATLAASAKGYKPSRTTVNLADPAMHPLTLELEPLPPSNRFVLVRAQNADKRLAELKTTDRVRDLIRLALADAPHLAALAPVEPSPLGPVRVHAWLLLDPRTFHITAVTEDGLHGASFAGAMAADWAKNAGKAAVVPGLASPYETQTGVINYYSGHIAAWYVYSAGKLDAISRMMDGEEFEDLGHAHAMGLAKRFLAGLSPAMEGLTGLAVEELGGISGDQFKAGFLDALAFFDSHPGYRGR